MIINLILGFLLVLAGRSLFWLCVGVVGFLVGLQWAPLLGFPQGWESLAAALTLGCAGAVLAMVFEWFMVIFGIGFLGGGYILTSLLPPVPWQESSAWVIFVVGGIIGACLVAAVLDWALIVLSSLVGAALVVSAFGGTSSMHALLLILTAAVGVIAQSMGFADPKDTDSAKNTSGHRQEVGV